MDESKEKTYSKSSSLDTFETLDVFLEAESVDEVLAQGGQTWARRLAMTGGVHMVRHTQRSGPACT